MNSELRTARCRPRAATGKAGPDRRPAPGDREAAFTLTELLAVVATLALLAVLAAPALASTKLRSQRAGCVGNLSQVGRAFNMWATDHGNRYPMVTKYNEGGTWQHPSGLQHNEWFQFAVLSNELATPKVLVCPADSEKKVAREWTTSAAGGFLSGTFMNNALSYLLAHPFAEDGRRMLCADRNLSAASNLGGGCGYWIGAASVSTSSARWLPKSGYGHSTSGNVLFNDGSVGELDDSGVRHTFSTDQPVSIHALYPGGTPLAP
jgi:prepilin-type processing-associated H-X9-DG protein